MAFEDFKQKKSVVIVYTGESKGKTTASIGLTARALGAGWKVAYIQFIKSWEVGEHRFFNDIAKVYKNKFMFYKGGKGFYNAKELSAKGISEAEHKAGAMATYEVAETAVKSGDFDLVVCDEINNAVNDGLITKKDLENLIKNKSKKTSLCVTGRNFPKELLKYADIATHMTKLKHHFDDKYLANEGIDF